MVKIEI